MKVEVKSAQPFCCCLCGLSFSHDLFGIKMQECKSQVQSCISQIKPAQQHSIQHNGRTLFSGSFICAADCFLEKHHQRQAVQDRTCVHASDALHECHAGLHGDIATAKKNEMLLFKLGPCLEGEMMKNKKGCRMPNHVMG